MDCFFSMGSRHSTCDDFSVTAKWPCEGGFTSVCLMLDGCSGSKNSSVGMRLLASDLMSKAHAFLLDYAELEKSFPSLLVGSLKTLTPQFSWLYGPKFLDGTLLAILSGPSESTVFIIGDGAVAALNNDGTMRASLIGFGNEAPGYPSYLIDDSRAKSFVNLAKTTTTTTVCEPDVGSVVVSEDLLGVPIRKMAFRHENVKVIMLFTDGVATFTDGEKTVPWNEVCFEFLGVKNTSGEFLKRKADRVSERHAIDGVSHADDFSGVAVIIG